MTKGAVLQRGKTHAFERDPHDWYVEPLIATRALLKAETFPGTIWDPACGQGNILEVAKESGYTVVGSDIVKRIDRPWHIGEMDFLAGGIEPFGGSIISNPPYYKGAGTEGFVRRALSLAKYKVAIFTSLSFLAGGKRAKGLFTEHPPHRVWVITPRVSCPPGRWLLEGNKAGGGSDDWCWLVWSNSDPFTGTSLGWLKREG